MSKNKTSYAIAIASILIAGLPAFAGETRTDSNQITVITGSGNYANSNNSQTVNNSGNDGNNMNVYLKSQQVCDIAGNNNTCINNNEQRVDIRSRYYRNKK
jgi:hypothetical protein